jgi:hypothetical protein
MFSAMKCGAARVMYSQVCWAKGPPSHGQAILLRGGLPRQPFFGATILLLVGMRGFEPPTF